MPLVPRSYSFQNVELKFLSYLHPETKELWVDGNGVAKSLGYERPRQAIIDNVSYEFKRKWIDLQGSRSILLPLNWQKNTVMINRAGWISLILSSKLPNALKIRDWVCSIVIPSIMDTGKYELGQEDASNEQMLLLQNEKKDLQIQLYESRILSLEREKAFIQKEHKYQMVIKDLLVRANTTATEFGVYGLLAKKNMEENDALRQNLSDVEDRVTPNLEHRPGKEEYAACYDYNRGGNKCIRITRNQLDEIKVRDRLMDKYRENPAKRFKPTVEKKYGWLRGADKFLQIKCSNSVSLWLKIRETHPHLCYGFRFCNGARTEIEFLSEEELREKYRLDKRLVTLKKRREVTPGFEDLELADEDDAVRRCLTRSVEARDKFKEIVESAVEALKNEAKPTSESVREDNHNFQAEDIVDFLANHTFKYANVININNNYNNVLPIEQ